MSVKGMLFSTDMVRAILDGRKTVTQRVVKPQPNEELAYIWGGSNHGKWGYSPYNKARYEEHREAKDWKYWTPPCHADDILYVRETWAEESNIFNANHKFYIYRADHPDTTGHWRPSIHMPRKAARIFLRVKGVRVERLQEINMFGIWDEGVVPVGIKGGHWHQWQNDYMKPVWDSTIKPADRERYGWTANPWVWVIAFERCEKPKEG